MAIIYWVGDANDGDLSNSQNWSPSGSIHSIHQEPGVNDTAYFDSVNTTNPVTLLSGSINVARVEVDDDGGGAPFVQLNSGTITTVTETIGDLKAAQFALNGGSNTVTGTLTLGNQAGSAGTYDLTSGALSVSVNEVVGFSGDGNVDQSGGSNTITGGLFIAVNQGSSGSYLLHGGTLSASTMTVGGGGNGNFDLSNGTSVSIGGVTNIAGQSSGQATLQVREGSTFTASGSGTASTINVGAHGNGSLNIGDANASTIGTVNANFVNYGQNADGHGASEITGSGSTLNVASLLTLAGAGNYALKVDSGGAITTARLIVGNTAGSAGALEIADAGSLVRATSTVSSPAAVVIGQAGTGGVIVDNGGALQSNSAITIGSGSTATGGLVVTGPGSIATAATSMMVGVSGTGGLAGGDGGTVNAASISVGAKGGIEAGGYFDPINSVHTLVGGTLTLATNTLTNSGAVVVDDAGVLQLGTNTATAISFINNKTVTLNSTGAITDAALSIDGKVALTGTGTITLVGGGHGIGGPGTLDTASKITGSGTIGDNGLTLINEASGIINGNNNVNALDLVGNPITNKGTIEATNASGAGGVKIEANVTNTKLIEALGSGSLVLLSGDTVTNIGATILASGIGAKVQADGATIVGGTITASGNNAAVNLFDAWSMTGATLTSASGGFIQVLSDGTMTDVTNTGDLRVQATLHVASALPAPVFNNTTTGIVTVLSGAKFEVDSDLTLQGGGSIKLNGSNAFLSAGASPVTLTIGSATSGQTIAGAGTIGDINDNNLTLINSAKGVINGNNTVQTQFGIDTLNVGAHVDNAGILEGTTAGGLSIGDVSNTNLIEAIGVNAFVSLSGTIINSGAAATILASGAGAHVDINAFTSITGGTLKTASGGVIQTINSFPSTITDVTNAGDLRVGGGAQLHIASVLPTPVFNNTTTGIVTVADGASLIIDNDLTLQGSGKIILAGAAASIAANGSAVALNNGTATLAHTLMGAGTIGDVNLTLSNQAKGIINGNGVGNALTLNTGSNAITNLGILEGTTAEGLVIASNVTNSNLIEALGTGARVDLVGTTITNNTAVAAILASGTSAHVDLDGADIIGGTLKSTGGTGVTLAAIDVIGSSTLDGSGTAVNNTAIINVQDNTSLTLKGTLNNTGTINLNSSGDATDLKISGNVTLAGAGKVILGDNANNGIVSNGSAATLTNGNATVGNTISGAGTIGDANLTLSNQAKGIIIGSGVNNALTLNTGSNAITNLGILEGKTAKGLVITSNVTNSNLIEALGTGARVDLVGAAITNATLAVILASGTSAHVDLDGADIIGGTLKTAGTGAINNVINNGATLDGSGSHPVTNAGSLTVADKAELTLLGTLNNNGPVTLAAGADLTDLVISGNVTINGTGTVNLSDVNDQIVSDGSAASLASNNNILGAGTIGDANLGFTNSSTHIINADINGHTLTIDTASFINAGILEATGQGVLLIESDITNTATGQVKAAAAGAHVNLDNATITGGTISTVAGSFMDSVGGSSTISTTITIANAGRLGAEGGDLTITGAVTNTGSLDANGHDLTVQGAVTGGTGTIEGAGVLEFDAASSAKITFAAGATGSLIVNAAASTPNKFTGTIGGFAAAPSMTAFTGFFAFGDSTIDSGWFPTALANNDTANETGSAGKNFLITTAVAHGGVGDPVGFGLMNSQILANDFGYTVTPADATGGGNNYAVAGATTAEDAGGTVENTPANGNTVDPGNGSIGNLNPNSSLPSTVHQIENYLAANGGNADSTALYLIGTGGNDLTFANNDLPVGDTKAQRQAYILHQADALAIEIEALQAAGAQTIVVHGLSSDNGLGTSGNFAAIFDTELFSQLDANNVHYVRSDLSTMVNAIDANPTKFGFTASTVAVGTALSMATSSAFIDFDSKNIDTGWGQWGAPTGIFSTNYAYLRAPNAEYTSLYSDNQHFSTQGQQIQADFDLSQLFAAGAAAMDSIDLQDISYAYGTTTASYAGTNSGGVLTVTDGSHTAKLTLSGDYTAADFVTATDGGSGTAVIEAAPSSSAQADITSSHLLDSHYAGAIKAGMNYAVLDFTVTKAVTLSGDVGGVTLSSADNLLSNGVAQTVTNSETIHGGGAIGDAFLTLTNSSTGIIDADSPTNGMVLQTTGHALSNSGTIEATNGGWLLVSHSTITDTATAHFTASGANSLVELDTATVNGGIVSVGAGAFMETVSGGTSTITAAVSDAGTLGAFNSSHLAITGAVTGAGDAHIGTAGILEFGSASSANVIFETFGSDHTGTLMLDTSTKTMSQFSGTISNFANGNDIDLGAINFTTGNAELSFDTGTNTLTVNDGTHSIDLHFNETHVLSDFTTVQDANHHVDLLLV